MKAAALLYLVSGVAAAATCQRLEYADVKDWPVEEVERAYCADQREMYAILDKAAKAQAPAGPTSLQRGMRQQRRPLRARAKERPQAPHAGLQVGRRPVPRPSPPRRAFSRLPVYRLVLP